MDPTAALMLSEAAEADRRREMARRHRPLDPERPAAGHAVERSRSASALGHIARLVFDRA